MRLPAASAHVVALALLLAGAPARAETTACLPITSAPFDITTPGAYCLTGDLNPTGSATIAIRIQARDVVLDCNGHRIKAQEPAHTGTGVQIDATAVNAVVRNCRIEGFYYGITAAYSASAEPRAARILDNRITRSNLHGIFMYGSGHVIEGNHISEGRRLTVGYPTGIYLEDGPGLAVGNVIRGNTIADFRPATPTDGSYNLSMGIHVGYQQGAVIEDNTIHGLLARTGGGVYGITTHHSREMVIRGNRVISAPPAAAPFDGGNWAGIFLQGTGEELATIHCWDNLVGHFSGNYNGCNSLDGNTSF